MSSDPAFSRIALLGPGLLGGSLAMSIRQCMPGTHLRIWGRRPDVIEAVRNRGLADVSSTEIARVVREADLVILCVPVEAMEPLVREILPFLEPAAVITDVGSVKGPVVATLEPLIARCARFVGSHPMAGSEQSGLEAARADLFVDSVCILTPTSHSDERAVRAVEEFWGAMGCRVRQLEAGQHDEVIALVSHLPHLLAAALTVVVTERQSDALDFSGPGFRDTTRVAAGPPEMWSGIFRSNRRALGTSLEALIEKLNEIATLLDESDDDTIMQFLAEAKRQRDRLKKNG